ncbi:MAG: 3'-5' exonuclease [Myxococcales bacterium]|nr:3'-5' exonuclease [Myxococcales bacterium]
MKTNALDNLVIIDTETGGLDPTVHSLLSIGLVTFDGARRTEIFVREPEISTHPRSMKVNGIDLDFIAAHGLSPEDTCDRVEAFFDAVPGRRPVMLAGHNIAFDLAYMRRIYRLAGRTPPAEFTHRSVDTHALLWALAAAGRLPPETTTSDGAFQYFNVSPPEELRHTALGDAVATRDLLEQILELVACDC